jgi:hypothetical protein
MRAFDSTAIWPGRRASTSRHPQRLTAGVEALAEAGEWLVATYGKDVRAASAGSVPFLTCSASLPVVGRWRARR